MPAFDGTGPRGYGPRTGRGFGYCGAGYHRHRGFRRGYHRHGFGPGYGPAYGRGFGPGYGPAYGPGYGRGYGRFWDAEPGPYYGPAQDRPVDEKAYLEEQAELLKAELSEIEKRMNELEQTEE